MSSAVAATTDACQVMAITTACFMAAHNRIHQLARRTTMLPQPASTCSSPAPATLRSEHWLVRLAGRPQGQLPSLSTPSPKRLARDLDFLQRLREAGL